MAKTLRFYIGVKSYWDKGERKEAEAVWPPLIDVDLFDQANQILNNNFRINKDSMEGRFPYILSGLCYCANCGDRMVGRSAHGRNGKIGYYEHAWSTKKASYDRSQKRVCEPYRVQAKQIEPLVWERVLKVLSEEAFARKLLNEMKREYEKSPNAREIEKNNQMIYSATQQIDRLSSRLAALPSTIDPSPIFKQMEKLQKMKDDAVKDLERLNSTEFSREAPCDLETFDKFRNYLISWLGRNDSPSMKIKVLRQFVRKIVVSKEGIVVQLYAGETILRIRLHEMEDFEKNRRNELNEKRASDQALSLDFKNFKTFGGSTTGQSGWVDAPYVNPCKSK